MAEKVPIWEKSNLTVEEASAYFGIGVNKLREMSNDENCPFVLWNGNKRLFKRKALEKYLETAFQSDHWTREIRLGVLHVMPYRALSGGKGCKNCPKSAKIIKAGFCVLARASVQI